MPKKHLLPCLALAGLMLACAGCWGGGSTTTSYSETKTVTTGQELMDLKKARDSGAISEAEYQRLRENIIKKSN
jgi:hypothetical protein